MSTINDIQKVAKLLIKSNDCELIIEIERI